MSIANTTLTLEDLPPPPAGKTGWPWTEQTKALPKLMPDGSEWPRISIVTPNYNYGQFLEETIRSVLLQGYPNLEYIVVDGASTDNSVEIIKKYEPWLTYWVSEPDNGQVDSINKGLKHTTGKWFNWLNSDDILTLGSLKNLAIIANLSQDIEWISGTSLLLSEDGFAADYWVPWRTNPIVLGFGYSSFPQDATFINLEFMRQHSISLCSELSNVFDTLLHWNLLQHSAPLLTTACFSAMRLHSLQKTADIANRTREGEIWLKPYEKSLPMWARVWLRLLRTRLHNLFHYLLSFALSCGVVRLTQNWKAAIYDPKDYEWKLVPARDAVFF